MFLCDNKWRFQTLSIACFKKVGYRFLVESTTTENASFPYKTAISEANVKTNKMVTTKWTYHKEWSFSSNYFIFLKILFQLKNLIKSWFVVPTTQIPMFAHFVSAQVSFYGAFSLWVSLNLHQKSFFFLKNITRSEGSCLLGTEDMLHQVYIM